MRIIQVQGSTSHVGVSARWAPMIAHTAAATGARPTATPPMKRASVSPHRLAPVTETHMSAAKRR